MKYLKSWHIIGFPGQEVSYSTPQFVACKQSWIICKQMNVGVFHKTLLPTLGIEQWVLVTAVRWNHLGALHAVMPISLLLGIPI